jgi:hypothetical protein
MRMMPAEAVGEASWVMQVAERQLVRDTNDILD